MDEDRGGKKSVIDYVIIDKKDEELVEEMIIDENREITPRHCVNGRIIYSDHNTITIKMNWNMKFKKNTAKQV